MRIRKIILFLFLFVFIFCKANAEDNFIVVFGNDHGELCSDLRTFLESNNYPYTNYSTSNPEFLSELEYYKKEYKVSEGMSKNFRYYPIVFVNEKAFSGFNNEIKENIIKAFKDKISWEDQKK
ncbi:MAG: hypothetical protein PHU74_00575 [Candidatus Pacebacteria bacterium]|nr:hypothetical protein [Candidatus Paceibacterota bacterium]